VDDSDGIADFLNLLKKVRAEKDGDSFGFEPEDQVADLAETE